MHFSQGSSDLKTLMLVQKDELGVLEIVMMQLSLHKGLKRFGKCGRKSALKEMGQLQDMHTFLHNTQRPSPWRKKGYHSIP
jgi:hypothetical protein